MSNIRPFPNPDGRTDSERASDKAEQDANFWAVREHANGCEIFDARVLAFTLRTIFGRPNITFCGDAVRINVSQQIAIDRLVEAGINAKKPQLKVNTLTAKEWQLIPWHMKGFAGNGLRTYIVINGERVETRIIDKEGNNISHI